MIKKYLIYIDILGFDALAEIIGKEKGIETREVRIRFIDTINERVKILEDEGVIIGKKYGESDDWLLAADSLDNVLKGIDRILDHNSPYEGYKTIPLEIAIGVAAYDKWAHYDGRKLIVEDATIDFLKTNIVGHYHSWYKRHINPKGIKSSFNIITEAAYRELELLDKRKCQRIEYRGKGENQIVTFFHMDVDTVRQRGKVYKFLDDLEYTRKLYERIDEIYVPPLEYQDIKKTLEEKRIVFITGTREYGKTYTAVRLMWEYFNKGYTPKWYKGEELPERITVRQRLENIKSELMGKHIVYFEDPFGKTKYEKRESLEREIGTIIESIKQVKDAYVIITSREEVFKEFATEKLSGSDLRHFESKLNIKHPSYDYAKRIEMLTKWAEKENCRWFTKSELRNLVLDSIKDATLLPTPLGIKSFVIVSSEIEDSLELSDKIREKSVETEKAFAAEIRNMSTDKILFLSFLFVSDNFGVSFIKKMYTEIANELNIKNAWSFNKLLKWFKEDKINYYPDRYINFSHPSYSEALEHLLAAEDFIREIFGKLLLRLSAVSIRANNAVADSIAKIVASQFDNIPRAVRNKLLLWRPLSSTAREIIAWTIVVKFQELPQEVRNMLPVFAKNDGMAQYLAAALVRHFLNIPDIMRNELLLSLSKRNETAFHLAKILASHFYRLRENTRNELLLNLSEKGKAAKIIAEIVEKNFTDLNEHLRNEILLKLSDRDGAANIVSKVLHRNLNRIPVDVRNEMLLKLSVRDDAAAHITKILATLQCKEVDTFLLNIINNDRASKVLELILSEHFSTLSKSVRNKSLSVLVKRETAGEITAYILKEHFFDIPYHLKNKLLTALCRRDEAAEYVGQIIEEHFKSIPVNVNKKILLTLAQKEEAAEYVDRVVEEYSEVLPDNTREKILLIMHKSQNM